MRVRVHLGYDSLGLFGIGELYGLPKPADQVSSVREGSAHNESPAIGPVAPETRRNHYRVSPPQDTHSPACADHEGQLITGDASASNVRTGSVPGRWKPWHISERWPTPRPPSLQTARWFVRYRGESRLSYRECLQYLSVPPLIVLIEEGWDAEVLEALSVRESRLSPISDEPARGLQGGWARRWPALRDVPWFPAAGDGACSNIGCGCVARDQLALMVGTSGAMRVLWRANSVEIPPGLWCYRSDSGRFFMGGALSDGGNLVAWLRKTIQLPDPKEAERIVAQMEPDSHGLTFLPLLAGERGPGWADHAHGIITGLSMATQPLQILRAALEAVALRFALITEILDTALPGERRVIATGGGLLGSRTWTQIMSDVLGKPIIASAVEEASSRGAALLVLEAMGEIEALESIEAPLGETFEPDSERHEIYRSALARQRKLYEAAVENYFDF